MSDQNKQPNKPDESKREGSVLNISNIAIFKDNSRFAYIYKKTEKLVSALYLLSGFISDKEPIKWQMREAGIDLLSQSVSLSDKSSHGPRLIHNNFVATGLKFLSFLEISYISGIISEMNHSILKYEFESLIKAVESGEKSLVFPEHFFEVPEDFSNTPNLTVGERKSTASGVFGSKGQNILSDKMSLKRPDKSNRQEIIIGLLKKNNELGIKDFTLAIKDCSEKTIQRELVLLVSKGQIKKSGEKRWSRYSIKV